jgi:hypothetical protein
LKLNLASGFAVFQKGEVQKLSVIGISFVNFCLTKLLSLNSAKISEFVVDVEASANCLSKALGVMSILLIFFF